MIPLMLACNDDHGNLDTLSMVEIGDRDGDVFMLLEGDIMDGDAIDFIGGQLRLDGGFGCPITNHGHHVGNLCWDRVMVSEADAARLANHLHGLKHWTCTEGEFSMFEKWHSKLIPAEQFTAADFAETCDV